MEKKESNAKWHVVLTRPGYEKKVAELFTKKNIKNYCPVQPAGADTLNGKKLVMEPVFKSYVFAKIVEPEVSVVLKVKGVINFAYWLDSRAVIEEDEIDTIRMFLTDFYSIRVEKSAVSVNKPVKITEALNMPSGEILHSIRASLPSLGYELITDVVKPPLEKIKIIRRNSKQTESFFMRLPSILKADRSFREG